MEKMEKISRFWFSSTKDTQKLRVWISHLIASSCCGAWDAMPRGLVAGVY